MNRNLSRTVGGAIAIVVVPFIVLGCGGSGSVVTTPSLYAGSWSGTWTRNSIPPGPNSTTGNATIQIDQAGNVSGSTTLSPTGVHESIAGVVTNQGAFTGSVTAGTFQYHCSGTATLNAGVSPKTLSFVLTEGTAVATGSDSLSLTKN